MDGLPPLKVFQSYAINTVITVSSLADSGAGSLRSAIATANSAFDNVLIDFSVSGTINLNSDLPYFNMTIGSVTLDGGDQIEIHKDYLPAGIALRIGDGTSIVNPTNYIIRNLTFTGFETGIVNYGDLNRFENLTIEGPQTLGVCDNTGGHGISVVRRDTEDVLGVSVSNNTVNCYRKGIFVQNVSGTTLSGNVITNNVSTADLVTAPVFADANPCLVAGIEVQGAYTLGGHSIQKNFITNNEITSNGFTNPGGGCAASFRSAGIMLSPLWSFSYCS
jgi:parallel beta-helix repeat protein